MKMKTKIISGFGIVIILLISLGVVSMIQFEASSKGFTEYRALARDTNLASRLQTNMLMVRMNVLNFVIKGSEDAYQDYNEYLEEMNKYIEEAQLEIQAPERAALIDKVDNTVKEYESSFIEIYNLKADYDFELNNFLNIKGAELENTLTDILISAEEDDDMTASFYSALSLKHLLLARLYVMKFIDENDEISHVNRVSEEFDKMQVNLDILDGELENSNRRRLLLELIDTKEIYISHFNNLVEITNERNKILNEKLYIMGPQIASWVDDVNLSIESDQDTLGPVLQASNDRANMLIIIILVVASVFGIAIALYTVNSVLKQLGADPTELESLAGKIALGDLRNDESSNNIKTAEGVYLSMLEMRRKLTEIVDVSLSGSEQIATASEELSTGNQDLSNRTEQQATALEETSSAIEEMNSSIRSNADNTSSANTLSNDALDKTNDGSQAVSSMIDSMNDISVSSNRIADIIEVINNIAFQTNLLALNASIEAARAGEQGKGFAVVAVEVRKLAKLSDKAASEIAEIIKTSNVKVKEGVEIANTAGDMLTEINGVVKKVTVLVGEIAASSQEQLSSVDQIDKTLSSLDENTQKNAALVEEAASSTEELSAQAQELNSTMQFFKLDNKQKKSTNPKVKLLKKSRPVVRENTQVLDDFNSSETYEQFSSLTDDSDFSEF